MKLLQTYSRNTSVDIKHKPKLVEKFFPLGGINKYITLQTKSGMPAKDYSQYQEVIDLLFPILEKEGIKILHLGQDSPPLSKVINLNNQTSIGQAAFLLKKSLLHVGADSWMAHFCGAEEVPLVSLYGSTTVANHSPYHFNKDKTIFLESHRNGNKATFAREENPKTVDFINPEDIASSVLKLLNLEFSFPYKTLFIGQNYQNRIIESAPNQVIDVRNLNLPQLIIRADYCFNEQNIFNQAGLGKISILTDRALNPQLLQTIKPNIVEIIYIIKHIPKPDPSFCKLLFQLKIPYKLISWLPNEELNNYKLDFLDFPVIIPQNSDKPKELDVERIKTGNIYYKSNKFLLSNSAIYQSKYSWLNNSPIPQIQPTLEKVTEKNLEELYKEKEFCYFLEKIS